MNIENNVATKFQSIYRAHKVRKNLAQNQDYILGKALYNWVNEVQLESTDRQGIRDQIQIINGQLVVNGDLDLRNTLSLIHI